MYVCFVCMYVCTLHSCPVPEEAKRGHQILWDWSYKQLRATMSVLRIEPWSSGTAVGSLNHCAISLSLNVYFKDFWGEQCLTVYPAGLELTEICPFLFPKCWDWRHVLSCPLTGLFKIMHREEGMCTWVQVLTVSRRWQQILRSQRYRCWRGLTWVLELNLCLLQKQLCVLNHWSFLQPPKMFIM